MIAIQRLQSKFCIGADHHQQIVEVVCYSARNRGDRIHSPRIAEFGTQFPLISDVAGRAYHAGRTRPIISDHGHRQIHSDQACILASGRDCATVKAFFHDLFQPDTTRSRDWFAVSSGISFNNQRKSALHGLMRRVSRHRFECRIDELDLSV